jgi:hypothetical protein
MMVGVREEEEKKKKRRRRRKKRRGGSVEEENTTIELFNPDRGTNKHVLPSFKKVPVFFSFSALCSDRKRGKKEELSWTSSSWESTRERERTNEQTAHSSSRSLSPGDSSYVRAKYVHARPKEGLTRIFLLCLSLSSPLLYEHPLLLAIFIRIFSSYIFPGGLKRVVWTRAKASERAKETTDVVAAIVTEQIPRKERFLIVR